MDPLAKELNSDIKKNNKNIFNLLSKKGKNIYFPNYGIISQSQEAKGKTLNSTEGIASYDNGSPIRLKSIEKLIKLPPEKVFPYSTSYGILPLRKKWKSMIYKKNPSLKINLSLPVVTNALTHGLSIAGTLFVNPNDKILIPNYNWENYEFMYKNIYNANIEFFNLFKDNKLDLDLLKSKLKGIKILILNFPNNPTGYTPTNKEADKIASIIKAHANKGNKIVVLCDDAYFGLVYEKGVYKESIFSKLANLHKNVLAVKIDGATKEDYVWGFRIGFITYSYKGMNNDSAAAFEAKTAGAVRSSITMTSTLSQNLIFEGMKSSTYNKEKKEIYYLLKSRYDEVKKILKDKKYNEYFEPLPFNSGYFMCIKLKGLDPEKIRQHLLKKYDTAVIALNGILRLAFSTVPKSKLRKLYDNIYNACKDLS
ncbi:aminotransferase class I/II-fold pyridoxal phosphate-dependent enzyme [Nanoarchaeota archaeon]